MLTTAHLYLHYQGSTHITTTLFLGYDVIVSDDISPLGL